MTFNIPRDGNKKLIKSSKTINAIPVIDQTISVGTTSDTNFASVNSLTLNSTLITSSATQINAVDTTPGIASPSKALVLDSSANITGINSLSCTALIVNGVNITSSMFSSGTSNDAANPYMTDIVPGIAQASKTLIFDSSASISNINKLTAKSVNINNTSIINNNTKNINLNNLYNSRLAQFYNINAVRVFPMAISTNDNTYIKGTNWSSVCWSPELSLYVAVCSGNATADSRRVMTSTNGMAWNLITVSSNTNFRSICWSSTLGMFVAVGVDIMTSTDGSNWTVRMPAAAIDVNPLSSICWSNELSLFVAVIAIGTTNKIITSSDGINWKFRSAPGDCKLQSICWSPELNLFVAVGDASTLTDKTMISSDGKNWSVGNSGTTNAWVSVCWSPERMLFVAVSSSGFMYSSDGYAWVYNREIITVGTMAPTCICWAKDIEMFLATESTTLNCQLLYSSNGYTWSRGTPLIDSANTFKCIIWNSEYQQFLAVSIATGTSTKVVVSTPLITSIQNDITGDAITFSKVDNNIGINSKSPSKLLEINSVSGNCFKHFCKTDNTKFISYDVLNTGQLNITTQKYFSVNANNSTFGLMLNNTLITTQSSVFNTLLTDNTLGIVKLNKPIIVDSNINISGINNLSCNSLIVNGTLISTSANNQYFQNAIAGTAIASSALIPDTNNSISNINNIGINKLILNNSNIQNINNTNLIILQDKLKYSKDIIKKSLNNLTQRSTVSGKYLDIAWSPELGLFVAVSSTGTNRLAYSTDGIIWNDIINRIINLYAINCICWSSELRMFVAFGFTTICVALVSYDGINWQLTENVPDTAASIQSLCWSPQLNLFVGVANLGTYRVFISNDGLTWFKVKVSSYTWNTVRWASSLNLFVASNGETVGSAMNLMYSSDGKNWNAAVVPTLTRTGGIYSLDWSDELNMFVTACNSSSAANFPSLYSYDGINWAFNDLISAERFNKIKWISDLGIFITTNVAAALRIAYSFNGINWIYVSNTMTCDISSIIWSSELNMIVFADSNTTNATTAIITSDIILPSSNSTIKSQSNEFTCDNINGRVGLGISTPTYQLQLSTDNAAKPSTSTWTVSSDERLKDNIVDANLNMCYNNIKNLKLKKYTWKNEVYTTEQVSDRSKLGWIAQEVETVFPKAVEKHNMHGYEDCRTLNTDQIIASMYGCAKQIIKNYNDDDEKLTNLCNKIQSLQSFINSLPDE